MKWRKLGLIFNPGCRNAWMYSHAQLPLAHPIEGDLFRIYFACRTKEQISQIGYVDIDITNPGKILSVSDSPVLDYGPIGFFDEHGVFPASIINFNKKKYLYYIGWNKGYKQPLFYASIGLAISEDNGKTFQKFSKAPIMSRSEFDPCLVTSPFVYVDDDKLRMYYVSGFKWEEVEGNLKSYYHLKYAESQNGIDWVRKGIVAIDFKNDSESNIARCSVIKENGIYKMWYSYVYGSTPYRIGYAESSDAIHWQRKDEEAGLDVSSGEFDSDMLCYPNVIVHNNRKYMFYNGNRFGKEGFGLAVSGD